MGNQALGKWAEQQAVHCVIEAGFIVLKQNYHSRYGEIDLIAQDGQELIFIEVKARSKTEYGHANEVVSVAKQRKMVKTALCFLNDHAEFNDFYCRFDVICFDFYQEIAKNVQHHFSSLPYHRDWIINAFVLDDDVASF